MEKPKMSELKKLVTEHNALRVSQNTVVESIDPEMAELYLSTMERNRVLTKKKVLEYAKHMASGTFYLHHQGIAFDQDECLIDGQHRLQAVVRSGCTVQMTVTRNVNSLQAKMTIDSGKRRNASDAWNILGHDPIRSRKLMAVVRAAMIGLRTNKTDFSHEILISFLQDNEELCRYYLNLSLSQQLRASYRAPWVGGFVMAALIYGRETIDPMFERMSEWQFGEQDPLRALASSLLNMKEGIRVGTRKGGQARGETYYALAVSGIKATLQKRKINRYCRKASIDFDGAASVRARYLNATPESVTPPRLSVSD